MKVRVSAKINLMLDVLGTLPDGYHSLFMLMQSVDCCDVVTVQRTESGRIEVQTSDARVPAGKDNIAYKAADAFFCATGIENTGVSIAIEKHIPMAAGLAGGSADAAGVLYCLNTLFAAQLSDVALRRVGESVGADVPFALTGGTALCMDKGGVIAPLLPLTDKYVVLCKPDMGVATAGAYRQLDAAEHLRHADRTAMLYAAHNGDYPMLCEKAANVFEQVIEVPSRPHIKGVMRACGADLTLMSGSGPTVYGLFSEEEAAKQCAERLQAEFRDVHICKTVSHAIETVEA